ncbi:calcium incorporation protein MxaA [Trinickia caryophylli]|uniref:MxaA protein n=1 Tax=Trinickia caryophylli TaxID=28094 RepID=A0A1X7E2H1_TRICW|nr:hypothetical protein [Trinickia caryophylli]PMS14049.1 calcium incorporation protein MxaA [Trinickia caryophylli]TRX17745.1 calcium incorporation protein MxaA [Trinickia caryophylli]WQE11493.1 calcium incorporation protein MxaA [Trinickia caryophylli]SMF25652.1 mxaA protein [Trinickia caryophylli]GLU32657.1 hypothetical protein Busp01_24990 [Trinickia caryophylli]
MSAGRGGSAARTGAAALLGVAALAYAVCGCAAAGAPPVAFVDEPRAFGHTIGDVLTQRVLLHAAGRDFADVAAPSSGRVGVWLERRPARIETDALKRRWMIVDYQVTNAPRGLTQLALPALLLRTRAGDVLSVPEWPISVGPLVPDGAAGPGLPAMRPDRGPPPLDVRPIARRLALALGALGATLAAWLGWWGWRNRREAAQLPFARAWRRIERLGADRGGARGGVGGPAGGGVHTDADVLWRIVHRALDETAGRVVHHRSLPSLFAREPWLEPLRAEIEQFYVRSDERFFAVGRSGTPEGSAPGHAGDDAGEALVAFARTLYRAERRRHR